MPRKKFLDGYKPSFNTLARAFKNHDVALMECKHRRTGQLVAAVCAVNRESNGDFSFVPFAQMLENGYRELLPPRPKGGFHGEVKR